MVIGVGNKLNIVTVRNDLLPNHKKFQKFKIRNFNSKELEKDFVGRSRARKSTEFSHDVIISSKF